jgi:hypothetical protein
LDAGLKSAALIPSISISAATANATAPGKLGPRLVDFCITAIAVAAGARRPAFLYERIAKRPGIALTFFRRGAREKEAYPGVLLTARHVREYRRGPRGASPPRSVAALAYILMKRSRAAQIAAVAALMDFLGLGVEDLAPARLLIAAPIIPAAPRGAAAVAA